MAKYENKLTKLIIDFLREEGWLVARINSGRKGNIWLNTWWPPIANDVPLTMNSEDFLLWEDDTPPYHSGFPDLVAWRNGRTLFVEAKTETGKASKGQDRFNRFAELSGTTVITPKGWDNFYDEYILSEMEL